MARLSGYVFENLEVDSLGAGKVILTNEIQQRFGVVDSETSAIVSLPGKIEDVLAWAILLSSQKAIIGSDAFERTCDQ